MDFLAEVETFSDSSDPDFPGCACGVWTLFVSSRFQQCAKDIKMDARNWLWVRSLRPAILGAWLARLIALPRQEYVIDGRKYWIDPLSHLGATLLNEGAYEADMAMLFQKILRLGDVFLDCGANEGYFSVLAAVAVGKHGRVLAVEPNPDMHPVITENGTRNAVAIELCPVAFSDSEGSVELWLSPMNSGAASMLRGSGRWRRRCVQVPAVIADDYLQSLNVDRIRLAKLDCEGAEAGILRGMEEFLKNHKIDILSVDYHASIVEISQLKALHERLLDFGYKLVRVASGPWLYLAPDIHLQAHETVGPCEDIVAFQ